MKENYNFFYSLFYLTIILYILWGTSPYLQRNIPNILIIVLSLTSLMLYLFSKKIKYVEFYKAQTMVIILYIYIIFQYLRVIDIVGIGNVLQVMLYFFPIFFGFILAEKNSIFYRRKLKILVFIVNLAVSSILLTNIMILIENPLASKYLTGSIDYIVIEYSNTNLATLSHVTFVVLLIPIYLMVYKESETQFQKTYLLIIILCIYFVILAGSMTATITMLLEIMIILLMSKKNKVVSAFMLYLFSLLILIGFLFKNYIGQLLVMFSNFVENTFYSSRLNEIGLALTGQTDEGSLIVRFENMKISVSTFFENPLIGSGFVYSSEIALYGVGMHSQIFDDLARFGIIGISLIFLIYFYWFKRFYIYHIKKSQMPFLYAFIIGLVFYSINNIFMNPVYGILVFFIIPLFIRFYGIEKEKVGFKGENNGQMPRKIYS